MQIKRTHLLCVFGFLFSTFCIQTTQSTADPTLNQAKYLPVSKVKPGMVGYGLSVFSGQRIEKFQVRVIDIVHNFNPNMDVILIDLPEERFKKTGVISGMSGSPIYLKDPSDGEFKLIGALAYGWRLSRQGFATAGVQPVEYMLKVPPEEHKYKYQSSNAKFNRKIFNETLVRLADVSLSELPQVDRFILAGLYDSAISLDEEYSARNYPVGITPLAIPLCASGLSRDTITKLSPIFARLNLPLFASGGGGGEAGTLEENDIKPGGVLAVPLALGSLNLTGIGTATERIGNSIWGFGHPMFQEGPVEFPISAGRIHTIIANMVSSFKLGSAYEPIGTLYSDAGPAVAGKIGPIPKMIDMRVNLDFAGTKTHYQYKILVHPFFAPLIVMVCAEESVVGWQKLPEYHKIRYTCQMDFEELGTIDFENETMDPKLAFFLSDLAEPVFTMLNNDFKRVKLKSLKVNVEVIPAYSVARIIQVKTNKSSYKPGENLVLQVRFTRNRQVDLIKELKFKLPENILDGDYSLIVGGIRSIMSVDKKANAQLYLPRDINSLFELTKHIMTFRSDRVYLALALKRPGLGINRYKLPSLPPSKLHILALSDPTLVVQTQDFKVKEYDIGYVIDGQAMVGIKVRTQE